MNVDGAWTSISFLFLPHQLFIGKTIGFLLFQYRLLKTHLEILWGYICWCLTKEVHSEGVYIGCYGYSNCNRQPEVIKFPKWAQFRTIYGFKNGKPHWPVAKVSKKPHKLPIYRILIRILFLKRCHTNLVTIILVQSLVPSVTSSKQ